MTITLPRIALAVACAATFVGVAAALDRERRARPADIWLDVVEIVEIVEIDPRAGTR